MLLDSECFMCCCLLLAVCCLVLTLPALPALAPLQEIVDEDLSALEASSQAVLAHPAGSGGSSPRAAPQPPAGPEAAVGRREGNAEKTL